ncbi:hypothetical protein TNCV_3075781 [Trichonephila clavipes]|nr:hypothetical protein TNCV_3075781 [Trichonephila clavipes]
MEQLLVAALLPAINAVVRNTPAKHVRQNAESVQTARGNTLLIPKSVQNGSKKKKFKELNNYQHKIKKDTATQTDIGTQTEISHIETPTNIANLTSESHKDSPIAQKPITNNLIDQETILSPPETSSTDLESLNQTKHLLTPDTSHLSVPSDAEALMEIDKSSIKRPATDIVQEAAKILKPSIRIESGGIQATKEDVKLLSKKGKSRRSFSPIKIRLRKA